MLAGLNPVSPCSHGTTYWHLQKTKSRPSIVYAQTLQRMLRACRLLPGRSQALVEQAPGMASHQHLSRPAPYPNNTDRSPQESKRKKLLKILLRNIEHEGFALDEDADFKDAKCTDFVASVATSPSAR